MANANVKLKHLADIFMSEITYLASYPRSGNTFMRALLANYFGNLERPLSVQEIAHFGFGEHDEALLTRCTGLGAGDRTIEDMWIGRSQYFEEIRKTVTANPKFLKTHTLNGEVFGLPSFNFESGDKIVYLLRHPLDVAVSCSAFFEIDQSRMATRMTLPGATNQSGGAYFEVTGSWIENVGGWLNEKGAPVLIVRFEDLRTDPAGQLRRVLKFLDLPIDMERVYAAARCAGFDILKTSQQKDGFYQGPGRNARATFFREGKAYGWKRSLDYPVAAYLTEALAASMRPLNYRGAAAR